MLIANQSMLQYHVDRSFHMIVILTRCGIAFDAWMLPLDDEVYHKVQQPLLFINSEKFQWATNVMKMRKLGKQNKMITIK